MLSPTELWGEDGLGGRDTIDCDMRNCVPSSNEDDDEAGDTGGNCTCELSFGESGERVDGEIDPGDRKFCAVTSTPKMDTILVCPCK